MTITTPSLFKTNPTVFLNQSIRFLNLHWVYMLFHNEIDQLDNTLVLYHRNSIRLPLMDNLNYYFNQIVVIKVE